MIKEACVETLQEALLAEKNGAGRIELCADLSTGGLTPSAELLKQACSVLKIPVMAMVRPRPGNFIYSENEIDQMKNDIDLAKKSGAAGVVFGLLTANNEVDIPNTQLLTEYARPLPVTFHKAIDVLKNPPEGVRSLKSIKGIKRILTSGGKATARDGAAVIRKMMELGGEDLIILVAGKVTHKNLEEIKQLTGAKELHGKKIVPI